MRKTLSDSLFHRLKPNEVFIKNNKTVKFANSGDTAAGVKERGCDYVRKTQATSFTGIVLMAGTNDLGGRKRSNGNDKIPEEVAQEFVNGAKKLLSFKSVKNVLYLKCTQDFITLKRMKKYSSLRRLRNDLLNPNFGSQKSALL